MPTRRAFLSTLLLTCIAVAAVFTLAGCGGDEPVSELKTVAEYFPIKIGDQTARLQLAVEPAEQKLGLMGRTTLGADDGMLFLYGHPQQMSFWMHNTLLPLDIGFFDTKGELREVRQMIPNDQRSVKSRSAEILIAIEMNQNWYRERGVKLGAKLDLVALKAALKSRGVEPRRVGLE